MENVILPLYDTSFKYLFKNHSRVLLSGLVKYISNINLEDYYLYDNEVNSGNHAKDMRLDIIFVKDIHKPFEGDCVNIELYKDFDENTDMLKSHYYVFSLIAQRIRTGDSYRENTVYQINFNDGYCNYNREAKILELYEVDNHYHCNVVLYKIFNVYLSNYKNICYNGDNKYEALLSLLRCNNYEDMRKIANGCGELMELIENLEELNQNDEILGLYNREKLERKLRDYAANTAKKEGISIGKEQGISIGKEQGISIGKEQGISIGKEQEKNNICINLLKNKIPISIICDSLNMNEVDVERIRETMN